MSRRRIGALIATVVLVMSGFIILTATPAAACLPSDPTCVTVGTGSPGSPGGGGSSQPPSDGGGSGGSQTDPCVSDPGGAACAAENKARMCSAVAADWATGGGAGQGRDLNNLSAAELAGLNQALTASDCPPYAAGGAPVVDPATLARRAAASFKLPLPSGHRSPNEDKQLNGYPFTYINLWTFYWTDPGTWHPLTATARAGANYATVTATPTSLSFNPGDGSSAASCAGPGRPWENSDGNSAPSAGACGYQYKHITGPGYEHPVTSTQTIAWELTWTGSNNTSGTLTRRTTSTTGPLNVLQIQTVNR